MAPGNFMQYFFMRLSTQCLLCNNPVNIVLGDETKIKKIDNSLGEPIWFYVMSILNRLTESSRKKRDRNRFSFINPDTMWQSTREGSLVGFKE